jgi:signal transduction histidine kinase
MIDFFLQLISLFLIAAGLLFILVEFLVKFDRSFLFLGIALIIFGFIPVSDIWVLPRERDASQILLWTRIQHILCTMLIPAVLWYLRSFLKSDPKRFLNVIMIVAIVISPLFFTDAMLTFKNGKVAPGHLYYFIYFPFVLIAAGRTVWLIIAKFKGSEGNERRILFYHLIGFLLLGAFGLIDTVIVSLRDVFIVPFPNSFILGVFAFGLMVFLIFAERVYMLVQDRKMTYAKLQIAYHEMEEAGTLRQIGESTAIINHEIKNYLTGIRGSAELIQLTEHLSDDGKDEIKAIMKSIGDLQNFSLDLLQLSRARIIKEKELLTIVPLIQQSIGRHFPDQRNRITLKAMDERFTIHGDWTKLEHVFVNIFKNAFEAEASAVTISVKSTPSVLLITIIDDGTGCTAEQLPNLFKAFYTTKKGRQGTGLGMSISRAIIESHGGHIAAYSRNGLGSGAHGLQITISLPLFAEESVVASVQRENIILVQEGMENTIGALMQAFTNVGICPLVVPSGAELENAKNGGKRIIIAAEASLKALRINGSLGRNRLVSLESDNGSVYVRDFAGNDDRELFSEEFIADRLILRSGQGLRVETQGLAT